MEGHLIRTERTIEAVMVTDWDTDAAELLTFDCRDDTDVSSAVTMAVSHVSGDDPMAMEPLASVIDPDAVANLFAPTRKQTERGRGSVDFEYHGHRVIIDANGRGSIYESDDSDPHEFPVPGGVTDRADD